ncbi:MAG: YheT family hydrolase [Pirellulaceae bacterium]
MFHLPFPEFVPHRLLKSGNAQTVVASLLAAPDEPHDTRQHFVPTTHDDQLVLHENQPAAVSEPTRQVILLHGLGGCHSSGYVRRTCHRLLESGCAVWRLDQRGCGAGVAVARWHHHAGRTEDLQAAVDHVRQQAPNTPITIVGFSLGANLALNWAGSDPPPETGCVDSVISIAPPVDLKRCAENLNRGLSRCYDLFFARMLRQRVLERRRAYPGMADRHFVPFPQKLQRFDDQFTAPLAGFTGVDEYYEVCSSWYKLGRIRVPALIVADRSDPVVPFDMFKRCRPSPTVRLATTRCGGHLGYLARPGDDPDRHWLTWRIAEWVSRLPQQAA